MLLLCQPNDTVSWGLLWDELAPRGLSDLELITLLTLTACSLLYARQWTFKEHDHVCRVPRYSILDHTADTDIIFDTDLRALHRSISPPQLDPLSGWSFLTAPIVSAVASLPSLSTRLMAQVRLSMS